MQRRAAAAYTAILVAIAAAAAYGIVTGAVPVRYPEGETPIGPRLWAIAALSGLTALVLLSSAYMPVRGD